VSAREGRRERAPGAPLPAGAVLPGVGGSPGLERCVLVGVVNVTPDSFSDGGRYTDLDSAVTHGLSIRDAGADLVDIGGESTRPGADRVDAAEETRRVVPVIRELAAAGVPLSIDTTRASVAAAALEAGAVVVNDVSGGLADPDMAKVVAGSGVPWILMHWRGHSRDMHRLASYADVVAEVTAELAQRVDAAVAAGVDPRLLVIDPGLGFAKTADHNWALLTRLEVLAGLGLPVLVASSRKSFLGALLAGPDGTPRPVAEREDATVATTVLAALNGAWGVRVHEVRPNLDALRVVARYRRTEAERPGRARVVPVGRDRVELRGLRVTGRHGVYPHERAAGQDFVIDAALELDTVRAAATDDLAETVDYGALAQGLAAVVAGEPVNLIETLADRLVAVCLRDPRVAAAEVTVHKPAAPIPLDFADVAVTVRRSR
jgi:dihydropteroate synthase